MLYFGSWSVLPLSLFLLLLLPTPIAASFEIMLTHVVIKRGEELIGDGKSIDEAVI